MKKRNKSSEEIAVANFFFFLSTHLTLSSYLSKAIQWYCICIQLQVSMIHSSYIFLDDSVSTKHKIFWNRCSRNRCNYSIRSFRLIDCIICSLNPLTLPYKRKSTRVHLNCKPVWWKKFSLFLLVLKYERGWNFRGKTCVYNETTTV